MSLETITTSTQLSCNFGSKFFFFFRNSFFVGSRVLGCFQVFYILFVSMIGERLLVMCLKTITTSTQLSCNFG